GDVPELRLVAADQNRVRHEPIAARQGHAALLADGEDRSHEVLVQPHAPGDAVHDDADALGGHQPSRRGAACCAPTKVGTGGEVRGRNEIASAPTSAHTISATKPDA